ncbi:hypothetical protein TrST_g10593 [Triparma strigata]|uniref:Uncharacterized protein n=1 Tax=Triparma strigata TaxID=1606541 RepID=A0A9W7A2F3_9STRA|nr:hypothetical protein TrST_g10593 [Triparma strigata]
MQLLNKLLNVTSLLLLFLSAHSYLVPSPKSPHSHSSTSLFGRAAAVRAQTKGKTDAAKTKIYGQFGKKIIMAVKDGGSASPEANKSLRDVISMAKKNNVPIDNINRAIKRASEASNSDGYQSSLFEVYAFGGCTFIINVLTDNPNRAAAEVKNAVNKSSKNKAKMAESGSVTYLYERKGKVVVESGVVGEEELMDIAIEAEVDDYEFVEEGDVDAEGEPVDVIYVEQGDLGLLRDKLKESGKEPKDAKLCYKPMAPVECTEEDFESNMSMVEVLEELEDVDCVEHNMSN